jgi:hypothetical protein
MPVCSVKQLVEGGAPYSNSDVELEGWVVDRFEHRAIYDTMADATGRNYGHGVWMSGALPRRKFVRGDGPLHGLRVKLHGKFHWQPRSGAGPMSLFPAWIGVRTLEVLSPSAEPSAATNGGPASTLGHAVVTDDLR